VQRTRAAPSSSADARISRHRTSAAALDRWDMDMRVQRMTFAGMERLIDRLKQYCASVAPPAE
jgi:hypothetical protein